MNGSTAFGWVYDPRVAITGDQQLCLLQERAVLSAHQQQMLASHAPRVS
jgi:hypothetical protein